MNMRLFVVATVPAMLLFSVHAQAGVLFLDDFESYTDVANTWVSPTDNDPTGYTVSEGEETMVQVQQSPLSGGDNYVFDTIYGSQFLHSWRDPAGPNYVWKQLTTAQQAEIAANGNMRIEVCMHNVYDDGGGLQDGWGGNIGIIAFDSAPEVWTGRAADLALNPGGTLSMYEDGQASEVENGYTPNTWQKYTIDMDFVTDRWSVAVDGVTVASDLLFEAGDLDKVQYLLLTVWDYDSGEGRIDGRGGYDNLIVSTGDDAMIPGDADLNGIVDGADAAKLAQNWLASGPGVTWMMGDFNDDKTVNDIDATILASNWTSSAASVPEPSSILFVLNGLMYLLIWMRRKI